MVSCRLRLNSSQQADLRDEFRSMRQPACACSAADHLPEAFRQELSTLLLFPDNLHECVAHDVSRYPEKTSVLESHRTLKS